MMPNMEIAKPTLADIPALLELWRGQYEYHHSLDNIYYAPYSDELRKTFEEYLTAAINEDTTHVLIARHEEKIAGFITFTEDEESYFDTNIKKFGLVIEVYVSDESRGHGVGKRLMEAAEDFFRSKGLTDVKLACSSFNKNTLDFYEHIGYVDRQRILFKKL